MKESFMGLGRPEYRGIVIGADHAGLAYAEKISTILKKEGFEVIRAYSKELDPKDDYPDRAFEVYQGMLGSDRVGEAIVLCGSGEGMCMAMNVFSGIRATEIRDPKEAKIAREHNGSNVLCLGARELTFDDIEKIISIWLNTPYSDEKRHARRREKVEQLDFASAVYRLRQNRERERVVPAILTESKRIFHERLRAMVGIASWVQVDIMDGTFTKGRTLLPNEMDMTIWPFFSEAHIMVDNPVKYIDSIAHAGFSRIIFHHEVVEDSGSVIDRIHERGMEAGVALSPKTPLVSIDHLMSRVDTIVLLGVTPGRSGQSLDEDTVGRVKILANRVPHSVKIYVDGGINEETAQDMYAVGAYGVCSASGLFGKKKHISMQDTFFSLLPYKENG